MKKFLALAALATAVPAFAADLTLDLAGGCKVYQLQNKAWVEVEASSLDGLGLSRKQLLRDESFTVFRIKQGTFGVNRRCLPAAGQAAAAPVHHRKAAPAPARGDTHSPWAAVFSLGYNPAPSGKVKTTFAGTTVESDAKYSGSIAFLGEANYRVNANFRMAIELGISQLSVNSEQGNETSFFDARPEYVLHLPGSRWEAYIGPMIGVFFLSQNTQAKDLSTGESIKISQQTATAILFGIGGGVDYALNAQFDLGFYLRYFKPGTLTVTGAETFPDVGATYSSELTASYLNAGLRFVVHF
jgi:hypothetical protein